MRPYSVWGGYVVAMAHVYMISWLMTKVAIWDASKD